MKRIAEKTVSCLLVLTMMVSMIPSQVFATGNDDSTIVAEETREELGILAGPFEINFVEDSSVETEEDEDEHSDNIGASFSELEGSDDATLESEDLNATDVMDSDELNNGVELQAVNIEFSMLSGKVLGADGQGISEVSVQIYNYDENVVLALCTTNLNGAWNSATYDVIAGYRYLIRYYKAGYEFSQNNIECTVENGGSTVPDVVATALNIGDLVCDTEDYTYTTSGEKATITKYTGTDSAIRIPAELGGYPVTEIGRSAFSGNATLKTLWLSCM